MKKIKNFFENQRNKPSITEYCKYASSREYPIDNLYLNKKTGKKYIEVNSRRNSIIFTIIVFSLLAVAVIIFEILLYVRIVERYLVIGCIVYFSLFHFTIIVRYLTVQFREESLTEIEVDKGLNYFKSQMRSLQILTVHGVLPIYVMSRLLGYLYS